MNGFLEHLYGSGLFGEGMMPKRLLAILRLLSVVIALLGAADTPAFAESRYVAAGTTDQPAYLGKVEGLLIFEGRTGEGR